MPLYEYECRDCQRRTEKIQKFSDVEITVCPHCGGLLERTITAPAVHFAGGGWYKDGYGSVKPPAAAGGEAAKDGGAPAAAPAAGSNAGSGESAPSSTPAPAAPATAAPAATAPAATAKS
jgi:putative FmdB family regulatory protein